VSSSAIPALRRGRLIVALAVLALAPASPVAATPQGVRLEAGAAGTVRFTVEVPQPRLEPLAHDPETQELILEGYGMGSTRPALPERIVLVAVPPTGGVRVSGAVGSEDVREGVTIAGLPWRDRPPRGAPEPAPMLVRFQGPAAAAPAEPVRLLGVSWLRDQRVAEVAIVPARYDLAARRLAIARRIEIEVTSEGGGSSERAPQSDPFESVYQGALVNYEQGRLWRRPAATRGRWPAPSRAAAATAMPVPDSSIFVGRDWVKIAVRTTGFYRVEFSQVRNSRVFGGRTTTPSDSVRLFTWPGVPLLPESTYCDSCGYREVAIQFSTVAPATFGKSNRDAFLFFALGASDWKDLYDPAQPETSFLDHPYETRNYYYLTLDRPSQPLPGPPRRIENEQLGTDPAGATTPATFPARAHFEVDTEYWPDPIPYQDRNFDHVLEPSTVFWEKWYWRSITTGSSFTAAAEAPGVDSLQPARLRARFWGLSSTNHYLDLKLGPITMKQRFWSQLSPQTYDTTFLYLPRTTSLIASVPGSPNPGRIDRVGLAWFDLFYQRRFEPVANELTFDSPGASGSWFYDIGPFSAPAESLPRVFDVTDALAPIELVGFGYTPDTGGYRLRFRRDETERHRYRVVPGTRIARPANADVFDAPASSRDNLRSATRHADYLLIYYDGFNAAAESLLTWRAHRLPLADAAASYDTAAVPISALYDQFSGGRIDPSAIRNFLRAAYFNWSRKPTFVTLLGDASSDFKNLTAQAPSGLPGTLVPSYEGGFDTQVDRQFATDDWLFNVDDPTRVVPDFLGGRIPATDAAGAMSYVRNKLLHYERAAPLGEWRNRVMLIADDNEQGTRPDTWSHLKQSADLERLLPPHIDRIYVYLHTYADGPNDTKPGAKADIIENLERGVLLFNYIGHGSPFKIADESAFLDSDASALTNGERPSVFVAASCDVGKYNDPGVQSLGERLLLNPAGGCVAVISSTELAFSQLNAALNNALYQELFRRHPLTGEYYVPISQALLAAKSGVINNQKYQVMGDAAVRLVLPRLYTDVVLESTEGDTLSVIRRGQRVRIRGRVLDRPGGAQVPFDGQAALLIEDSVPLEPIPGFETTYSFRASPMFRGDVEVRAGELDGQWIVPLDSDAGPRARARAYLAAAGGGWASDAVGSRAFDLEPGAAPPGDDEGPRITLSFPGGATSVRPDAVLRIDLLDDSGILITGRTPQNGIVVTVDENSTQRSEVSSTFRYAANSYQSGTAFFTLPNLSAGPHTIRVSAADNLAVGINAGRHRSSATIAFEVTDNPSLQVTRAMLFPNPTSSRGARPGGQFVVDSPGDSVNVLLRIYTVSGRLIRTLTGHTITTALGSRGQAQLAWDGLDDEGFPLANGVYLFRVHVNPRDPDGTSSARQQAAATGRFVIVNR
jgi:peptidase C25-like protein/flagellar hook capping protein FlgD